jgi:hypothetical protein
LQTVGAVIAKDLCTYTMIILHQEKILRDHGRAAVCRRYRSELRLGICTYWQGVTPEPRQEWNLHLVSRATTAVRLAHPG